MDRTTVGILGDHNVGGYLEIVRYPFLYERQLKRLVR